MPYYALWPVLDRYRNDLQNQARGRWKKLPRRFINEAQKHYSINLDNIQYAENIETWHGAAITIENRIYFPIMINLQDQSDVYWMLHEIEHSVQYARRGGYKSLMSEYAIKSVAKIIENQSVNVHDYNDLERAADRKASYAVNEVSSMTRRYSIGVDNKCPSNITIAIRFEDVSGFFSAKGWWDINRGENVILSENGTELTTYSRNIHFYAESDNGHIWTGAFASVIDGETINMRAANSYLDEDGDLKIRLTCDK
jgi:uncharacterized membrane protein